MPIKPVAQWTLDDATRVARADLPKDYEINRLMVEEGDQWQGGTLWPGHRSGDAATDALVLRNVEPQFVADDVVSEMIENRSSGLLKQEADVSLPPRILPESPLSEEAQQEQDRRTTPALADLAAWWDRKGFQAKVNQACDRVSYAQRASLRAMVAEGNLVNGRLPTVGSLAEALDLIEIDAPLPTNAVLYTDPRTQKKHAVVLSKVEDRDRAEVWSVDPVTRLTGVRILGGTTSATVPPLDLGGRLPVAEVRGQRILTESVRRLQSLLNFITTVTGRTVETAGFRERYLANVEPPGIWSKTPPSESPPLEVDTESPGGPYYKHRVSWVLGAPYNQEIQGLKMPVQNAQGEKVGETFATPDVTALDPVDPAFATNAADKITARLYRRGRQGHLALEKTGETSGVAYQQARAQFEADLMKLKGALEGMIRDILEAVLALAGLMYPAARSILTDFRVQVVLTISAGPITPDEARLATELRDKRAISQQTMMARVGVEDPVAEEAAIVADPFVQLELVKAKLEVYNTGVAAGLTTEVAARLAGFTPEEAVMLETGVVPVTEKPPVPKLSAA